MKHSLPPGPSVRVCVCVCMSVCHFLRQIILQFPFTCPQSPSIPSSIQTAPHHLSQVQSLNSISLPAETLYLLQLYRVGGISRRWSSPTAPKVTHSAFGYCMRWNSCRSPPLLAPWPFVCIGDLSPCRYTCCSTLRALGANKRFLNGHPWGFSDSLAHIYRMGSKGQRGFSSAGSAYICKTLVFPAAHHKCLDIFFHVEKFH